MNRFKTRPLSYSQLAQWEYNKEEWHKRYILGIKDPPNAAMQFGTVVGDSIGTPSSLVPDLVPPGVKEYELSATLGDIFVVGYCDHFCPDTLELHENKTSTTTDRWTQKKADEHGQLTMYALMLFRRDKIKPEDIDMRLNFIPVEMSGAWEYHMPDPVTFTQFKTRRTTVDVVHYIQYIEKTVKEMELYVKSKSN